ncbi:mucin-2-like isoform X1 [Aedes albopictus]|uniref:ZAD domain-containing protein n=1 Tax=Aedes albopictus TaxID=7160 RepID=A0ABM1XTY9_AEDAL
MSLDETKMEPLPTAEAPPEIQPLSSTSQSSPPTVPQETIPAQPPAPSGVRIRPKTCDVRDCDSNSLRNPDVLFVCVPSHSYPERRFVWLTLMQAARDKKRSYCCSRHFKVPDDFKDFQEFISAPPGYKRQLLVKKGVVPHLNMPPLNMSALPPLTNRWPMTLPTSTTELEQMRHNAMAMRSQPPPPPSRLQQQSTQLAMRPPQSGYVPSTPRIKYCKGVQTDSTTASIGPRKVPPSLQYCRLCFQKQDLEPIFTGDQTLIEPDLIDKIFGCTEIMISVESDFPSSICTDCYNKVHEYVTFRKLVQRNDQSLRGIPLPPLKSTPVRSAPSSVPRQNSFVRMKTTELVPNRPTQKVTPIRPVNPNPPKPVQRSPVVNQQQRDDPLLEVQRVENVERYQRRQETIERNQPLRAQRVQDTLYPVPYRRPTQESSISDDPLASADNEQKLPSDSEDSQAPEGVQLTDRIVPVTLIRVRPESSDDNEVAVAKNAEASSDVPIKEEEPSDETTSENVTTAADHNSPKNMIRPRPLHQLMRSPEQTKPNPPNVLQAVKLLPSATAKAMASQKPSLKPVSTLTRGITSGRFPVHRIWNTFEKSKPKPPVARMLPKTFNRAVRLPGLLSISNLINRAKKHQTVASATTTSTSPAITKDTSTTPTNLENRTVLHKTPPSFQAACLAKHSTPSPVPKSKAPTDAPPKPQEPQESTVSDTLRITDTVPVIPPKVTSKPCIPSTSSPIPTKKIVKSLTQSKEQESSDVKVLKERTRLAVVLSKLPSVTVSLPSPISTGQPAKPVSTPVQKDTSKTETSSAPTTPSETNVPPSPRSSRVRKVPLKFQNTVGFPMPKIITVKADPDAPPTAESIKAPAAEKPKETTVRVTRRSAVTDDKPASAQTARKKPEAKETATKSKPKEDEPPKNEPTRMTRRSDTAIVKPDVQQQRSKPPKRKSDTKLETKDQAPPPPPSKSPKLVEPPKTKQQPPPQQQQKPKQTERANGSEHSAPEPAATEPTTPAKTVKPRRRAELERAKTPVSSQDWKCPFCTNKTFEEKKRLVKHLRKRHGMDYALVRQQLAIYGGNWRY